MSNPAKARVTKRVKAHMERLRDELNTSTKALQMGTTTVAEHEAAIKRYVEQRQRVWLVR